MEATDHPAENLVGRALSPIAIAAYGAKKLVERDTEAGLVPGGEDNVWVEYLTDSEMSRASRRLRTAHAANARIHVRTHSLLLHVEAVRQGVGYAFLPCIWAESDPNLLRVGDIPPVLGPSMWMLTHPDLRGTRRVKVFMDFVRDIFDRRAHELLGSEWTQQQD
jgi:DNA-binding transcriptional LysR family regulator